MAFCSNEAIVYSKSCLFGGFVGGGFVWLVFFTVLLLRLCENPQEPAISRECDSWKMVCSDTLLLQPRCAARQSKLEHSLFILLLHHGSWILNTHYSLFFRLH